ncbi:Acetyltransferase [Pedobacter sp. BAL39]|uniref:GNAT family N-acetyltransferase n=1 Tax=Pedobacter sp. BAL39 TaxID=391596 RepID=UPI00015597F8|nr:GNAT family protein [Pedobacter sp. BAL39]EDM37188.1 Acetyltransferase [Pedobacter sp. BAL39]
MIEGMFTGLRGLEREDLLLLRDWRNKPHFRKNFREHKELSLFHQEAWYNKTMASSNDYMFGIVDLHDQQLVGVGGLLYINWILRSADFSFYIGKDDLYVDEHYAPDAIESMLKYGFEELNLNKIWMELYEFDTAKFDLFTEHFGFSLDGRLRQNAFYQGRYWDSNIISLLAEDYKKLR